MTKIYKVIYSAIDQDDTIRNFADIEKACASAYAWTMAGWRNKEWAEGRVMVITLSSIYSPAELACRMLDGIGYMAGMETIAVYYSDRETKYYDKYRELVRQAQAEEAST